MFARPKMTRDGHQIPDSEKSFKQAQWRRHRQITVPILIIVFALAMFGAIYLAETSRAAVTGRHVQQLRRQVEIIGYENDLIHANNGHQSPQYGFHPVHNQNLVQPSIQSGPVSMAHSPIG